MEEHLAEDTSLNVLADLVRLSPYHFLRSFKRSFGAPPHRYWTGRRIEHAKALLANPRASVSRIAIAVGFSGTGAFSTTFHRITGRTPTDFAHESHPRWVRFEAKKCLYSIALTLPRLQLPDKKARRLRAWGVSGSRGHAALLL